eukprot:11790531-Alexandrium_andersonii.AAC.1
MGDYVNDQRATAHPAIYKRPKLLNSGLTRVEHCHSCLVGVLRCWAIPFVEARTRSTLPATVERNIT